MTPPPDTLPLFPLKTVLFPGGVLPLRVFEPRYMDMITRCMREDAGFGVCLIAAGEEVGETAVPHPVGTEARIEQWDMAQAGVLNLVTRGIRRFRKRGKGGVRLCLWAEARSADQNNGKDCREHREQVALPAGIFSLTIE